MKIETYKSEEIYYFQRIKKKDYVLSHFGLKN